MGKRTDKDGSPKMITKAKNIMKLKEYIDRKKIPVHEAARQLKIAEGYLYELIAERRVPGKKTAFQIIKWSDGFITLKDLWEDLVE